MRKETFYLLAILIVFSLIGATFFYSSPNMKIPEISGFHKSACIFRYSNEGIIFDYDSFCDEKKHMGFIEWPCKIHFFKSATELDRAKAKSQIHCLHKMEIVEEPNAPTPTTFAP